MKNTKATLLGVFCTALIGWTGTISAETLIDADFDNLAPGPVTFTNPVAGVFPIDRPTTGSYLGSNTATVTTNAGGNSLVVNKVTDVPLDLRFHLNSANTVTSEQVKISFDLTVNSDVISNGNFFITIRNSTVKTVSALILAPAGTLTLYGYQTGIGDATSSTGTSALVSTFSRDTIYHIEMLLDFDTGMNAVSVNGGTSVSQPFAASGTYGVRGLDFSLTSAPVGNWTFDNITLQSIPEPSSLSLMALGLIALSLLKRSRNQA